MSCYQILCLVTLFPGKYYHYYVGVTYFQESYYSERERENNFVLYCLVHPTPNHSFITGYYYSIVVLNPWPAHGAMLSSPQCPKCGPKIWQYRNNGRVSCCSPDAKFLSGPDSKALHVRLGLQGQASSGPYPGTGGQKFEHHLL